MSRCARRKRQLTHWEPLEPRLMLSHDGDIATNWDTPAEVESQRELEILGAGPFTPSPLPQPSMNFSTLANGMPILNSYPDAPAAIFLDFDGDSHTGNTPYDVDGDPTKFNATEQATIAEAWRHMSIYFAMFNVNVTTIQPAAGIKVAWNVISPDISGGWSYVNVFPNSEALSFNNSSHARTRISALAHEVGHNFGNWHTSAYDNDGVKTREYHGAFDSLHGPLMGLDYTGTIHKWTTWHSSLNAATLQDDMAAIANDLAALNDPDSPDGYRPDDYGGTIATAATLTTVGNTQTAIGIIERLNDVDMFKFTSVGGAYNIMVGRDNPSGVDVKVSVYDAAGVLLASEDGDPRAVNLTMVNDAHVTINTTPGTYYVKVESHGNYGDQGQYVLRVDRMAAGWQNTDIGLNGVPGYASYDSATGTYTVAASGYDIWNDHDGMHYLYQTLTGDGSITVRVTGITDTHVWAQAGVMIRETLAEDSKNVGLNNTYDNGLEWYWRSSTGGNTSGFYPNTGADFAPTYVRIVRAGNTFTAFRSTNGEQWTQFGTAQNVSMNNRVYIGLAVSSINNAQLNVATFTNLTLTGNINAPLVATNSLPPPTNVAVSNTTSTSATVTWNAAGFLLGDTNSDGLVDLTDYNNIKNNYGKTTSVGDTNGDGVVNLADYNNLKNNYGKIGPNSYSVERSSDGINFVSIGIVAANVGTFTDTNLADAQRYFYRISGRNATGHSQPSAVVNGVTRAGVIDSLNIISESETRLILDWHDASGETGYRIERSDDGLTGWTTRGNVGANVPMYVDTGLTAGRQYYYRIASLEGSVVTATSDPLVGYTKLPAVTGLAFTNKTSTQMAFSWNAVAGATGYLVEKWTPENDWQTLAASQTTLSFTDNNVVPMGQYYYYVTAINANTKSVTTANIFAAAPASTPLPSPWASIDVGAVGGTGAASYSGGAFTVTASGTDLWGTADQFRYVYATMTGAGFIQAKIESIEPDNDWTWAGVMIRATSGSSTAAGSRYAAMLISPNYGSYFQYRTSTNGSTTQVDGPDIEAPYYLRVERTISGLSSRFKAFVSPTGDTGTWTQVGTEITISSLSGSVRVGLVVSSVDNADLDTVVFTNVSSTPTGVVSSAAAPSAAAAAISSPTTSPLSVANTLGNFSLAAASSSSSPTIVEASATQPVSTRLIAPLLDRPSTTADARRRETQSHDAVFELLARIDRELTSRVVPKKAKPLATSLASASFNRWFDL